MPHVRRFDHIGITVADLDSATAFFVGLGLEVEGTVPGLSELPHSSSSPRLWDRGLRGTRARQPICSNRDTMMPSGPRT